MPPTTRPLFAKVARVPLVFSVRLHFLIDFYILTTVKKGVELAVQERCSLQTRSPETNDDVNATRLPSSHEYQPNDKHHVNSTNG